MDKRKKRKKIRSSFSVIIIKDKHADPSIGYNHRIGITGSDSHCRGFTEVLSYDELRVIKKEISKYLRTLRESGNK